MSSKEFCVCRGCPQYWKGIGDKQAKIMAETTAVNVAGELVQRDSGRRVMRKWGDGGEVGLCGPQTERVIALMRSNGGVRRHQVDWEKPSRVVPLGEIEADGWVEWADGEVEVLEDYRVLPMQEVDEGQQLQMMAMTVINALGDDGLV